MSAVRMCDSCGTVFPEAVDGSSTGQANVTRTTPDGRRVQEQVQRDACPPCTRGSMMPQFPQARAITQVDTDKPER